MKKIAILFALILCVALAGCNQPAPPQSGKPMQEPSGTVSTPPVEAPTEPLPPAEGPDKPTAPAVGQIAMVYIGTKTNGFTEYPMTYDGELTPEKLIQGIADLTGWDLTLADPQREQFFVYDAEQLAETILDSIQKTLQEGFTLEGGDPDALDIWYYMEGEQPLELPALGLSWPSDQPYQWAVAETE